jgi:hypothetical protein
MDCPCWYWAIAVYLDWMDVHLDRAARLLEAWKEIVTDA